MPTKGLTSRSTKISLYFCTRTCYFLRKILLVYGGIKYTLLKMFSKGFKCATHFENYLNDFFSLNTIEDMNLFHAIKKITILTSNIDNISSRIL